MESIFKVGQTVKYSKPQKGEEMFRFKVLEVHEADGEIKEKLLVEQICDDYLKPRSCFFSEEFVPVKYFGVDVRAIYIQNVQIEADDWVTAEEIAEQMYEANKIILTKADEAEVEFNVEACEVDYED